MKAVAACKIVSLPLHKFLQCRGRNILLTKVPRLLPTMLVLNSSASCYLLHCPRSTTATVSAVLAILAMYAYQGLVHWKGWGK